MCRLKPIGVLAALLATAGVAAGAEIPVNPFVAEVNQLLREYSGHVPGAAVLVIKDGVPVLRQGFGLAEVESGREVTPRTAFRLASVSKQFTATAILLLAQDGIVSLDDSVRRWLPELPAAADAIRIRHMLSHTSGLLDYEDLMDPTDVRQVHDADVLALLAHENRTLFVPGTDYRYSNSGYALLALVVERASGLEYSEFLRQRIFSPLGMSAVAFRAGHNQVPDRAYGHSLIDGHWQRTDQSTTSAVLGDGGIYASIDDLERWDAALYDDRLLRQPWRELATSPATRTDEPHVPYYGFGWRLEGDLQWHSGESIGFRNVILRWPSRRFTVIVLSNRDEPEPFVLAQRIAADFAP